MIIGFINEIRPLTHREDDLMVHIDWEVNIEPTHPERDGSCSSPHPDLEIFLECLMCLGQPLVKIPSKRASVIAGDIPVDKVRNVKVSAIVGNIDKLKLLGSM